MILCHCKQKKKQKITKAERERLTLIEKWENTPAANPLFRGMTPCEIVQVLLKPKRL